MSYEIDWDKIKTVEDAVLLMSSVYPIVRVTEDKLKQHPDLINILKEVKV